MIFACVCSCLFSLQLLIKVMNIGNVHYYFGAYEAPIGIEFSIDTINALLLILISFIGLLTFVFTSEFDLAHENSMTGTANTVLGLLITGLLGMSATGDVFNLYVFLEITSISAYCLISMGGSKGTVAAFRYMLVGTIAASFYLIGIGILYASTGSLNMSDIKLLLQEGNHNSEIMLSLSFLIAAFATKMALFPFHGWQPAAYTHAEPGARPLIAGIMSKVPAYALFRYIFCVFGDSFKYMDTFLLILGIFSSLSILYGSVRAMAQTDVRKMLSYSSVAQIGYITLGFAIGTPMAIAASFIHIIGHAFMKSGLFFSVGAIRNRFGVVNMSDMGRIYKQMPITTALLTMAGLSMVGVPPLIGFFSKWYLGVASCETHNYIYLAVLIISSLLNAIYFFNLFESVFIREKSDKALDRKKSSFKLEANFYILIPVVLCLLALVGLGIFNVKIFDILMISIKAIVV